VTFFAIRLPKAACGHRVTTLAAPRDALGQRLALRPVAP